MNKIVNKLKAKRTAADSIKLYLTFVSADNRTAEHFLDIFLTAPVDQVSSTVELMCSVLRSMAKLATGASLLSDIHVKHII